MSAGVERVAAPAVDPDAWGRAMREGAWEQAWRVCDDVLRERGATRCWHLPRHEQWVWDGSPVDGRRVLVRCYHGLGDTLQFVRFLPQVRARAAEVTLWAQPALLRLLATAPGIDRLLPLHDGAPEAAYDVDVEVMELAHVVRAAPGTVGGAVPYLHVPPAPLARGERLAVGLVWESGDWARERRSIPVELLAPLADVAGVALHVLQRGPARAACAPDFGLDAGSDDVYEAARTMRALDLVVTIDSMPAHLAGALGVPVWVLLPHDADWRWMTGRDDSPWYPTARLFRQHAPGAWAPVVARVAAALAQLARAPRPILDAPLDPPIVP
ncbi:glycosyltransferase family 9 protein [Roseisolibacter agri]|uniref:Glycosyltransferase family 9 (Heptosyltransferase) n=1 Tax=Roseisolibacter agri TaxID=2014610 RepID=A0AA37Q0U5_9BACT|nr:hypothetical protein [Roseisolibacter agri]GLC24309.1 hypothetical protein rosag_08220 [Roseisolibacter agri]